MKLGVSHDVCVVKRAGETGWRGFCLDCNWTGTERVEKWDATGDVQAHVEEAERETL